MSRSRYRRPSSGGWLPDSFSPYKQRGGERLDLEFYTPVPRSKKEGGRSQGVWLRPIIRHSFVLLSSPFLVPRKMPGLKIKTKNRPKQAASML